jgi:branched-chain amino acid transport system permease protein
MANAFVAAFEILSFGAIIVLIVLGLGIIASMMGIFNFAQGEFVLLGAYITYLAYAKGIDRKSTRLNSSHRLTSRMPSSA